MHYQSSYGLPGRIKIRWNTSHKNHHRRTRSFSFLLFLFLASFSLVCLFLMPTSYRPIQGDADTSFPSSLSSLRSSIDDTDSLSAAAWSVTEVGQDTDPPDIHHDSVSVTETGTGRDEDVIQESQEEKGSGSELSNDEDNIPSSSHPDKHLPGCIIIGGRKCGTRALLEFIGINSKVVKVHDEVHFFDEDSKYSQGLDWYRSQMPYSSEDQITIEKTPAYFVTESAPDRIRAMNQTIKLIVIVRDPVVRLISDYAQLNANKRAKGERPLRSFSQMVLTPEGDVDIHFKPVKTSIYAYYFSRWTETFPASQILVVDGDRLVYDPFPEVRRVEDFLGLEHEIIQDHFVFNATKGFYCIKSPGSGDDKCLNETKGRRHPKVPPAVIHTLRKFYAPYNHQFYTMVGKDYNWPED